MVTYKMKIHTTVSVSWAFQAHVFRSFERESHCSEISVTTWGQGLGRKNPKRIGSHILGPEARTQSLNPEEGDPNPKA